MNLKQLEAFELVAGLGSVSRAAAVSAVSQSLLSRQIAQLEAEWGDRLFERTGRGVVLTEFGSTIQPEIRLLLEQKRRLEFAVKDAAGVPAGTVQLGIFPSMSRAILPTLFEDLRVRAPSVRLDVTEGFNGTLDRLMTSGKLDVALINRYAEATARGEDILGYAETFLVGRPGSTYLAGRSIRFRELAHVPLVVPAAPNSLRAILDQQARQQGIALDVAIEVDTLGAMKDVAASGSACTLLARFAVDDEIASGRLAATRVVEPGIRRVVTLALSRHRPLSRAARLVASRVRELAGRWLDE